MPISRISVTGNGVLQGFLWFEDLELSYVPGPAGAMALLFAAVMWRRRR
jgi:hypothetical protein